jgi:hypothetical protein
LQSGLEEEPDAEIRAKARIALRLDWAVDKKLPDDVRRYLWRLVSEKSIKPPKRGRPHNTIRDEMLVDMIAHIQLRHGISPIRNRAMYNRHSGCDIISQVLGELGIDLDYEGVEEVWRQMGHRALPDGLIATILDPKPKEIADKAAKLIKGKTAPQICKIIIELTTKPPWDDVRD